MGHWKILYDLFNVLCLSVWFTSFMLKVTERTIQGSDSESLGTEGHGEGGRDTGSGTRRPERRVGRGPFLDRRPHSRLSVNVETLRRDHTPRTVEQGRHKQRREVVSFVKVVTGHRSRGSSREPPPTPDEIFPSLRDTGSDGVRSRSRNSSLSTRPQTQVVGSE